MEWHEQIKDGMQDKTGMGISRLNLVTLVKAVSEMRCARDSFRNGSMCGECPVCQCAKAIGTFPEEYE